MPYLIKTSPDQLFSLDYGSRNGLYYKIYAGEKTLRTNVLYNSGTEEYTATKDHQNNVQVVCKNRMNQIIHFIQRGSTFQLKTILDDYDNNFQISNLNLQACNEKIFLYYTAKNLETGQFNIIQHNLTENNSPQSITTVSDLRSHYECHVLDDHIFMLSVYPNEEQKNELLLNSFNCSTGNWEEPEVLYTSAHPIIYTTMCFDQEQAFHILYTTNQFGQYNTSYLKINIEEPIQLENIHSTPHNIKPIIFSYNHQLWLNWQEGQHNYMMLSTTKGTNFTKPHLCSDQPNNLRPIHYFYDTNIHGSLYGQHFYGVVEPLPSFSVLKEIDMDQIHIDAKPNKELKLFISSLQGTDLATTKTSSPPSDLDALQRENDELKRVQRQISTQYEELTQLAKDLQSEGKKWRSKFFSAEMELRAYQNKDNNPTT